ncbi:MAG: response regulator transcription factor [Acidimicrobiales bacterium]
MRILVVDDEPELAEAIAASLRRDGYAVDVANTATDALDRLMLNPYDLVTLDLTLPDLDGREVCRLIRTDARYDPSTRVLMVTARDEIADRVAGLDDGADDYLVKPFALAELSARVRSLLRREVTGEDAVLQVSELRLDTARRTVTWAGTPVELTTKEFSLLRYFMTNQERCSARSDSSNTSGTRWSIRSPTRCGSRSARCAASWPPPPTWS